MFYLLCSHNHDLLILWPSTLSQSRIRIPAQKKTSKVSCHLFFCPHAPVLMSSISLNTFAPFFFNAITVPFAQHGCRCTVRSLNHQTHVFSEVGLHLLTLPLWVGILQSPLSISFLFFNFIKGLLLGLHASPAVSSFQDAPKASLGDDTPAMERSHRTNCLKLWRRSFLWEVLQSINEKTVNDTFVSYDASKWDIPRQRDRRNTSVVVSQAGLSSVPSCACVTAFASPQCTPTMMQLICCVVSPVSTCACVQLSMLLPTSETFTHEGAKLTA